ncbi:MAG: signal peptidase I [Candidatus Altiarchaeales archaeon HGW-Altiarchaeales-2]|nr:MAG: signal peptidase I [Candidatus Altiarchaeales archaeon HGW-Altiarchaeales-2]
MASIIKELKRGLSKLKEVYNSSELVQTACYLAVFLFVFFVVLPFVFGTPSPINSVVSSSMEHHSDAWESWLLQHNFTNQDVENIVFGNGFNAGDMVIAVAPTNIKKGDVILYNLRIAAPDKINKDFIIIHRVVEINETESKKYYALKGDNNLQKDPVQVPENAIIGKAVLVIPYLGWPRKVMNDLLL